MTGPTIHCEEAEALLSARLDRALAPEEASPLEAHLAGCARCRAAAGEYAALASDLDAALRATSVRPRPRPARSRRPRRFFLAAAAAAAAAALVLGAILFARVLRGPEPAPQPGGSVTEEVLESGTVLVYGRGTQLEALGPRNGTDEVVRLVAGEVKVRAASPAPGRRAVVVETELGTVETLGTVFTVRYSRNGREGGDGPMHGRRVMLFALATLVVGVDQGAVLLSGEFGAQEVRAGEEVTVAEEGIKARVLAVKVADDGGTRIVISAGAQEGVRKGFEFTCEAKGWRGTVERVQKDFAVLAAAGAGKAAVGDLVRTGVVRLDTGKVAEGAPAADPTRAPAAPRAAESLHLTLVKKTTEIRYRTYQTQEGDRITVSVGQGGGNRAPDPNEVRKPVKREHLVLQIRNAGEKAALLPAGYSDLKITVFARDAEGKAVPERAGANRWRRPAGANLRPGDGNRPVTVTVLRPGQALERPCHTYALDFSEKGKYTIWAELEVKPASEVLPGVKLWSGKLRSNAVEHEVTYVYKRPTKGPSSPEGATEGAPGQPGEVF